MLCKWNPEHECSVVTENGVKVLDVHLIKAIYGLHKVCIPVI